MSGMYGQSDGGYGGGGYGGRTGGQGGGGGGGGYEGYSGGGGYGGERGGRGRGGGGGSYGGNRGGDRGGGRGGGARDAGRGGGRGVGGRDGDWPCPNPGCGNLNFARRTECNKCGTPSPASSGDRGNGNDRGGGGRDGGYSRGSGGGYGGNRGGRSGNDSGRSGGYDSRGGSGDRSGSYGGSRGREDATPAPASYSGAGTADYAPPVSTYGGNTNYGTDAVPPPSSYTGAPSYPPSYSAPTGSYGCDDMGESRNGGRRGPSAFDSGSGGGAPRNQGSGVAGGYSGGGSYGGGSAGGGYGNVPEAAPTKLKQCDETCGDNCENSRIYISNLPPDVTVDDLTELFKGIGQIARIKQKRGFKDQWPWNVKIYTDDSGKNKGDACLVYEDPQAAHCARGYFNEFDMRGYKIQVSMAEKSAPKPTYDRGGGGGGRGGGYGGGGDRRNRDGGSGPDRNYHGGNRSRPY